MSKDIYNLLNDIETDFSEYDEMDGLDAVTAKRLKNNLLSKTKRGKSYKGIAVAACCVFLIAGMAAGPFKSQVKAAAKLISYNISSALGLKKDLTPYENIVNQSVTNDGVTITLNNVILTKDSLIVSFTEYAPQSDVQFQPIGTIYVNGQHYSYSAGGGSIELEDGTMESVMEYGFTHANTADTLDIELIVQDVTETHKGTWNFAFQATGSQLSADTQEVALDTAFVLPDSSQVHLDTLSVSPIGPRIYFTLSGSMNNYDMKLEGEDDLGNPVAFYVSQSSKTGGRFNLDALTGLVGDNAVSLTLTPYAVEFPEESGKMNDNWQKIGETFTISLW